MEENCHNPNMKADNKQVLKLEKSMIKTSVYTLIFLIFIEILTYYGFFRGTPDFFSRYGYYTIFLVISILINAVAVWHVKSYRHVFSHMNGMMVGMTIGMSSGFTIGLIIGATNGMFIGSLAGLIIGMAVGSYTGKCCGIMGVMEGMMAGLMGGIMGAMTSIMSLNDNLKYLIPVLILGIIIILIGLINLIYKEEVKNRTDVHYEEFEFLPFITIIFIITLALTFLMVYGPKALLFS